MDTTNVVASIWQEFLKIIREEAGSRVVETWFKAVTLTRWDSLQKTVELQAPNQFVCDWIKTHYVVLIQEHLGRLLNVSSPKIIIDHMSQATAADAVTVVGAKRIDHVPLAVSRVVPANRVATGPELHGAKHYSFSSFVVGPNNSLAHAAAHAVTQKPGTLYNPLFLFGGSGLGKTHLLHAIGNEIKTNNVKATVLYQSTDRFVNEFITAIRFDRVHKFQEKYKGVDVLLIDDVQFIANKEQTQEAFFHIFNTLYESHKQIVFSSDTFPQNMEGIAERLRSRLAWGLVADIHVPSLETKIAIITKKAAANGEQVDDDVAHFIASHVISNVRELEGALIRVTAFASLTKQSVTLELARRVLLRSSAESHAHMVDFEAVIRCLKKHYTYSLDEFCSKNRNRDLSYARQVAMFLMKKVTGRSLRDIGAFLGGRDHSTVVHALECVERRAATDPEFAQMLHTLEHEMRTI